MKAAATAAFAWLVPGGGYLMTRRYRQFAVVLALVCCATAAGMALGGATLWPQSAELAGLDSFSVALAQGGAAVRWLAGAPYLVGRLFAGSQSYLGGQTHEYGTTLLVLAGLFNLLALVDGLEARKGRVA